jgi:hypothetical protein
MRLRPLHRVIGACLAVSALVLLALPTSAASLSRSVDVDGTPSAVWSAIGPFCAIRDWHPAIGTCAEDGKSPSTRTLVTKDGTATFVELNVSQAHAKNQYSYTFVSSPLPVTHYRSTLKVTARGNGSKVTWSGDYTPDNGKEKDADQALAGIYETGLQAIKDRFAK